MKPETDIKCLSLQVMYWDAALGLRLRFRFSKIFSLSCGQYLKSTEQLFHIRVLRKYFNFRSAIAFLSIYP
jgi:hypothetical protein